MPIVTELLCPRSEKGADAARMQNLRLLVLLSTHLPPRLPHLSATVGKDIQPLAAWRDVTSHCRCHPHTAPRERSIDFFAFAAAVALNPRENYTAWGSTCQYYVVFVDYKVFVMADKDFMRAHKF